MSKTDSLSSRKSRIYWFLQSPIVNIETGDTFNMRKESSFAVALLALVFAVTVSPVFAQTSVNVNIMDPYSGNTGAKGLVSNGYWVGEIPVKISSATVSEYQTVAYCINYDKLLYINQKYSATLKAVPDSAEWRAVSYLLTWNYPADNYGAAVDQIAFWRLLNVNYKPESWLDANLDDAGKNLADSAYGKDVARKTDRFTWISPVTGNMQSLKAEPNEVITFKAQLTSASGIPRPNVRVLFSAMLNAPGSIQQLDLTYVNPMVTHTDSQGIAQVKIRVPPDALMGSTIEVKASTRGMWPQQYVDIINTSIQDLIGIGETFEMTTTCNLVILSYIMVVPESPLGALTAIGAVGAAFTVYKVKVKQHKKKNQ